MKTINKPIVIVGSGFAGITAAINLRRLNPLLPILVVDSESKFLFKPLMYEVLSKEIREWEVAPDFLSIFSNLGITFLKNYLMKIKLSENILEFQDNLRINYQYLVLCTGSSSNTFSVKGVKDNCNFFNNLNDLNQLKLVLDKNLTTTSLKKLFIVGAGPSGVELACKINDTYAKKFAISIIESSNEILSKNKIFNREEAEKSIGKRKINLLLNSTVKEVSEDKIIIVDSHNTIRNLNQDIVIWTAGVKPKLHFIDEEIERLNSRILINENLQIKDFKNVFAIGDISIINSNEDLPITAQLAMQQGNQVAKNLDFLFRGKELSPFKFEDNGEMMSLGIGEASISALGLTLSGKLAFDVRRLIYASKMPIIEKSLKSTTSWLIQKKLILDKFINKSS